MSRLKNISDKLDYIATGKLNKEQIEYICEIDQEVNILHYENERLNNIIDEFGKWLLGEKMMFYKGEDGERLIRFYETTKKWLELKGSDKDE